MYAIVKTGGKQYKVAEGDVITVEKLLAAPGAEVALTAILLVDGDTVTTDHAALAAASVTGEVVAQTKGPKIKIHKYKNKTGYHKRMGHRQKLTELKITSVGTVKAEEK
jgi:large subunit ribosomal protein L21